MGWKNQGHVFDKVGHMLDEKENCYIYGVGMAAKALMEVMARINDFAKWNIYLVDQDVQKQREGRYGFSVMSPEYFFSIEKKDYFVIAGPEGKAGDEIVQIVEKRMGKEVPIFKSFDFIYMFLPIYFAYTHKLVFFSSENMLLSTVCNLNCRDCLNFTPYIKKHWTDSFDQIKENVDLFFGAVDLIYRFQITGGEPLLYKDIIRVMDYVGSHYGDKIICFEMVTNGTVVPSDELCAVLKKYKVRVYLDDYRKNVENGAEKYARCLQQLCRYDIDVIKNSVNEWFRMYIPEIDENRLETEEGLISKYRLCGNPWSNLWNGKISSCN